MVTKKVHIISHSHWDREWYMAYEQHHMRLINLIDDLLELFQTDPDFHSFHLDGQTIILDDYLQVRPEREPEIKQAIATGKLRIGPFYILQDDFLTSSESNMHNMLIGKEDCDKWGASVHREMIPRFEKAYEVGHYLAKEAAQQIAGAVNTSDFPTDSQPFLLFNTSGHSKTSVTELSLTWKKYYFGQRFPKEVYQEAQEYLTGLSQSFQVIDVSGNTISEADILDTSIAFDYDLPKRTFREPYFAIKVRLRLPITLPAMSWKALALQLGNETAPSARVPLYDDSNQCLENEFLKVMIQTDGRLTITDKQSGGELSRSPTV
ncbi:glycoside hydrolase family 38 N-terminal domain-containing protein [Streptococcus dysgalactiae]|nr:alpha-mannosidase [Streptococcus dysgalactiae]SUN55883.1 alpha-mannosidase [Streptococcus dysgalactiae]